jgi:DNA-binding NtrC family response regulator
MSIAYAELETAPQSERFMPRTSATRAALFHCLIVSDNEERRMFLTEAARTAGWEVAAYDEATAASAAAHRTRFSLSIVDLDGLEAGMASGFRTLADHLSTGSQTLLVVCGTAGNPLEEIWARQLGVWLYLAGVDPSCDVTSLCGEAKQVVEKLAPHGKPAYARTA